METIGICRGLNTAAALAKALSDVMDGESTYVVAPDGSPIDGFKLVEETLTDGSTVQTIILFRAQQ